MARTTQTRSIIRLFRFRTLPHQNFSFEPFLTRTSFEPYLTKTYLQLIRTQPVATMKNLPVWIVLFSAVAISRTCTVVAEGIDDMCCLCDECYPLASGRDNLNVDEFGTTCNEQLLAMAAPDNASTNGSGECAQ